MKTTTTTQLFRYYRSDFGLTQEQLAYAMGTSRGHIANIENGRVTPTDETLARLTTVIRTTQALTQSF
jgi:transcriptional regulator with XRE-family HTH domain